MEYLTLTLLILSWLFSTVNFGLVLYLLMASKHVNQLNQTKLDLLTISLGTQLEQKLNQKMDEKTLQLRQIASEDAAELIQTMVSPETKQRVNDIYSSSSFERI